MTKILKSILIIFLIVVKSFGQSTDLQTLIDQGIQLYDKGDYTGAINVYKQALKIDQNSAMANYEIASTYVALKNYELAIEHCEAVIAANDKYIDHAYMVKGTALDMMGKSTEAITTYERALKEFPNNHLIQYNLAVTAYNIKDFAKAEGALQQALKIKPSHASSHLLLGYILSDQGFRVKSLLALYNFLLLEPEGNRAKDAFNLLETELKRGVNKLDEQVTTITVDEEKSEDEFYSAELMLSLLEASKNLEDNKKKPQSVLFFETTRSFFTVLGEIKKENKGFWWDYYVDFFYNLTKEQHVEAFSYYISLSKEDDAIYNWLNDHKVQMEALSVWYSRYVRNY